MDLNYEISPLDLSLELQCIVKVVYRILSATGKPGHYGMERATEADALKKIEKMGLPRRTEESLKGLVKPVNRELCRWYPMSHLKSDPMLKPQGTVDMVGSTKLILEDKTVDYRIRYLIACAFCHEEHIFKLSKSLSASQLFCRTIEKNSAMGIFRDRCLMFDTWNDLSKFWFPAYQGIFCELVDERYLPQQAYDVFFKYVLECGVDSAIKYFANNASVDAVRRILDHCFGDYLFLHTHARELSPTTYCLLFSKMDEEQRQNSIGVFARLVLEALLQWPYQIRFLRAAQSLTEHLDTDAYWVTQAAIIQKVSEGYEDYDYQGLFSAFWELGTIHRGSSQGKENKCHQTAYASVMLKGMKGVKSIAAEMSTQEKELLLLEFDKNRICATLIFKRKFLLLRAFVETCSKHSINLLVEFKSRFLEECPRYAGETWFGDVDDDQEQWENGMRNFADIVGKIVDERNEKIIGAVARLRFMDEDSWSDDDG